MIGPVQVLVVGLDDPNYSGEVLAEFSRLKDAGIVRLIDPARWSRAPRMALSRLSRVTRFRPAPADWPLVSSLWDRRTWDRRRMGPISWPATSRLRRSRQVAR